MEKEVKERKRCNNCGSTLVYFRIKDHSLVCRSCGKITDIFDETKTRDKKED